MQGIETLGFEVIEQPMIPEGGLQEYRHAAEMLADFGRNGDTYVVHAAEGETVIPLEVLEKNPKLKNMIYAQMASMGLEPERYIVGNELNSLNPKTGQPEFFFKKLFKGLKKVVKKIANVVKKVAPIILPIAAPFVFPLMPAALATGLGSFAGNLVAGKSVKDSAIAGLTTGAVTGVGNMLTGGSFLGSKADPGNVAGFQGMSVLTPDNPFTEAVSPTITAVQDQVAAGAGAGAGAAATDAAADVSVAPTRPTNFAQGLKMAFTPGDDYGFGDFWNQFLSPGRESIKPEVQEGYKTDLAAFTAQFPNATATEYNAFIKTLDAKHAPGLLSTYGPIAASALAAGATSDALLGTNIITPEEEKATAIAELQNAGENLLREESEKYGIGDIYGGNPYYDSSAPSVETTSISNVNPTEVTQLEPIGTGAETGTDTTGVASTLPDYSQLFAQNNPLFQTTPYSNINYFNPMNPSAYVAAASGGEIMGPGTPTSDSIPAMLSDGEFVMNARAVRGAGGGDRREGAKRMYDMMRQFERRA